MRLFEGDLRIRMSGRGREIAGDFFLCEIFSGKIPDAISGIFPYTFPAEKDISGSGIFPEPEKTFRVFLSGKKIR